MALYIESMGQGPDLVLLHGWGLNGGVWQGIAPQLAARFRLHLVDLPGVGHSPVGTQQDYRLDSLVQCLLPALPARFHLLGWSMGGLLATRLALLQPERLLSLVTVASAPHFVAEPDWPGIQPQVLQAFSQQLQADPVKTIERFLAIQAMGSEHVKEDVRQLRQFLAERPAPDPAALAGGLRLLAEVDLRDQLANIRLPWLRCYGRLDALVPHAQMALVERLASGSQQQLFAGAAHAPFISHPQAFVQRLSAFLTGC